MLLGLDFDNTIVNYDRIIHTAAVREGLVPATLPVTKSAVRDYLRAAGREHEWTELQAYIYGPYMSEADPYPGVAEFLQACRDRQIPYCVISHKTRFPYRGPQFDLREAAWSWLSQHGFVPTEHQPPDSPRVFFESTKQEKLQRIGLQGCTHFIDDLPEFLAEASFPPAVQRILFDPNDSHIGHTIPGARLGSWALISEYLFGEVAW